MSQMTTLSKVHERVERMSQNHVDQFINVKDISFESLDTVNIGDDYHKLRPVAQQSIANRLGIPIQYLRRCPKDIQALNMNHWIRPERYRRRGASQNPGPRKTCSLRSTTEAPSPPERSALGFPTGSRVGAKGSIGRSRPSGRMSHGSSS